MIQEATLSTANRAFRFVFDKWIVRRLLASLTVFATTIGVSEDDARGTTAFLAAVAVFAFDQLQGWIRRRWIKPAPPTLPNS